MHQSKLQSIKEILMQQIESRYIELASDTLEQIPKKQRNFDASKQILIHPNRIAGILYHWTHIVDATLNVIWQ